jgi:hypothetical protein
MLSSVLQIFLVWFLPESPRWLVEQGRIEQATAVLVKYHADGDASDPIVELELAEIMEAIEVDRKINQNVSFLTMVKNKANRSRTMIIVAVGFFSQWSGVSGTSIFLSTLHVHVHTLHVHVHISYQSHTPQPRFLDRWFVAESPRRTDSSRTTSPSSSTRSATPTPSNNS